VIAETAVMLDKMLEVLEVASWHGMGSCNGGLLEPIHLLLRGPCR